MFSEFDHNFCVKTDTTPQAGSGENMLIHRDKLAFTNKLTRQLSALVQANSDSALKDPLAAPALLRKRVVDLIALALLARRALMPAALAGPALDRLAQELKP